MGKSNPYLKSANTEDEYTYEQIRELQRCAKDPVYFIENYVKIVHPTDGIVYFKLFDYQREMVEAFHEERYSIVLSARQTGKCVTKDTTIKTVNADNVPWYKRAILWFVDHKTYVRLYS